MPSAAAAAVFRFLHAGETMTERSRPRLDYRDVVPFPSSVTLRPIGVVRSPFQERFGTPRQSGLPGIDRRELGTPARVELDPALVPKEATRDLEGMDYIWLITFLHLNGEKWPPMVRPPRGGPKRGILSTRAPHRPNPLGLSAVRLTGVDGLTLHILDVDMIDGTPVLDVKPYVAYCDAHPEASTGWVDEMGGRPRIG